MSAQGSQLQAGGGSPALRALLQVSVPLPSSRRQAEAQVAALHGALAQDSPWQVVAAQP